MAKLYLCVLYMVLCFSVNGSLADAILIAEMQQTPAVATVCMLEQQLFLQPFDLCLFIGS